MVEYGWITSDEGDLFYGTLDTCRDLIEIYERDFPDSCFCVTRDTRCFSEQEEVNWNV